jgi:glutamate racemase
MLGIFDSGLGGLTVVRAIEKRLPDVGYVYLGDTARLPYGTKSPETIERYALQALAFLREAGATRPIIACHTVSSILAVRSSFRKTATAIFEGVAPLDVVTPAIAAAKRETRNGRIGILATRATIFSGAYQRALKNFRVVAVPASLLVALAEEGWAEKREIKPIVANILAPFLRSHIDTLVLACTHFPILKKTIRGILKPSVAIIDPGEALADILVSNPPPGKRNGRQFFATDIPDDFAERASRFLGRTINATAVML